MTHTVCGDTSLDIGQDITCMFHIAIVTEHLFINVSQN